MIHYASSLLYLGNLIDYVTLRFEAKHVFIKTAAITTHNCINLPFSVMKKHQIYNCLNLLTNSLLNCELEVEKFNETELENVEIELKELLISLFNYNFDILLLWMQL